MVRQGLRLSRIENANLVTNRALIPPIFSGKTRVHDRDRLFRIGIIEREIAAFQNFQAERGKITVRDVFKVSARTIAIGQIILSVDLILAGRRKMSSESDWSVRRELKLRIGPQRADRRV